MVRANPVRAEASMSEVVTLLPSPTSTTCCSGSSPRTSSRVSRSARTWQGCERSVRPLITGFSDEAASCRMSSWVRGRAAAEPRDDAVHVAIQHPGGVGDGLPDAELDVLLGQGGGGAAKPCDPHLERDARAMGGFLEEHGDVPAFERAA